MTEEQIKKLKKGDTFTLKLTVAAICQEGVYADLAGFRFDRMTDKVLRNCILEQPAPTFEVGDTVRIVPDPLTGTVHNSYGRQLKFEGLIVTLSWLNKSAGQVTFKFGGNINEVSIHCLELVKKAVKDKYSVVDCTSEWRVCENLGQFMPIAAFVKTRHPNAEAAAKAECDRLNAEWRKQQEGKEGADHE